MRKSKKTLRKNQNNKKKSLKNIDDSSLIRILEFLETSVFNCINKYLPNTIFLLWSLPG